MNIETYEYNDPACIGALTQKVITNAYAISYDSPSSTIFNSYDSFFNHIAISTCPLLDCKLMDAGCSTELTG